MKHTRQKQEFSETNSAIFKSPRFSNESPPSDSTSKRAHQVPMLRRKSDIKRLLREEEE